MSIEDLQARLKRGMEMGGMSQAKPITSHELAKKLLAFPDQAITLVKGEGEGYFTEWTFHPGGPWLDHGGRVRMQIERLENKAAASS